MSKSQSDLNDLIQAFQDKDFRESYADDFLNTHIASQIRAIREQRELTQEELAELVGTKQTGISRIENVNYSGWNIKTLKKIAFALDGRLHVSIETFGSLLEEGSSLSRGALKRPSFEEDLVFARAIKPSRSMNGSVDDMIAPHAPQKDRGVLLFKRPLPEKADSGATARSKSGSQEDLDAAAFQGSASRQIDGQSPKDARAQ